MRRSFVRLVVTSVLACWVVGFAIVAVYVRSQTWTEAEARRNGVFLVHEWLNATQPGERAARLEALRPSVSVPYRLVTREVAERETGARLTPGEWVSHRPAPRAAWYFLAFDDGAGVLAAGPVHPALPNGVVPVGLILAIIGLPVIVGTLALRVERGLREVERANEALATGDLATRVDGAQGPSTELAESFNAMAERVERLIRSRDELVQAVSHELGTPLARLRFHIELLGGLEGTDGPDGPDRLNAMTREVEALEDLVAEFLGYVQTDNLQLDRRTFDPRQALADIAELATLESPDDRTVDVSLELAASGELSADQRLFLRAVENILRNAVRYAKAAVRVELTADATHVRVTVHDDGPGIPAHLRSKVLTPFFRADADRGRKTGGVGLGLAIVNRIVLRHGGRVDIDASPLGGASVATVWPVAPAS